MSPALSDGKLNLIYDLHTPYDEFLPTRREPYGYVSVGTFSHAVALTNDLFLLSNIYGSRVTGYSLSGESSHSLDAEIFTFILPSPADMRVSETSSLDAFMLSVMHGALTVRISFSPS